MISIITAVHNQLAINKIFLDYLKKYTHYPYELIIIDNNSTDGTREFFKENGAIVIENDANYSYPYTQNQGIKIAKYDVFAFLNNDITVAPNWDLHLLEAMKANALDVATVCGIERLESAEQTKAYGRRWKRIKNVISYFNRSESSFRLMHKLMYGNWEKFSANRFQKFGTKCIEGFVGNSVVFTRRALDLLGLYDERIQAADFDLYVRAKKRNLEQGDIKPCHIALGVYNHHYIRITLKSKPPVFVDADKMIRLEDKWTKAELDLYLKDNVST
jgi:GT2 family glycosyltransferase